MRFETQLLKGIAPIIVLEIISRGRMYGYELCQAVERRSQEILSLGKGTLCPLLYNLEAKGQVVAAWETADSGQKRRYYSMTEKGHGELARQKEQLKQLVTGLDLVFGGAVLTA